MSFIDILTNFFGKYGYIAIFIVLLACGLGIPIPEDITLVTGGIIAGSGNAHLGTMITVGMLGVLIGDTIVFSAGRIWGYRILNYRLIARTMTPKRYAKVQEKFDRYGNWVLFVARFLPGLRVPIYVCAGISKRISYLQFLAMDGLAASLSVPLWIYLGSYGAQNIDWLLKKVHQFQFTLGFIAIITVAIFAVFLYRRHLRIKFFRAMRQRILEKRNNQQS